MAKQPELAVMIRPNDDHLVEVILGIKARNGRFVMTTLEPYQAAMLGKELVQQGLVLDDLNDHLMEKTLEVRKEIMDLHAQYLMPAAEDPFQPAS